MKRVICILATVCLLVSLFVLSAGAVNDPTAPHVEDRINLFSDATQTELNDRCNELSEAYDTCCLILTTGSLSDTEDLDLSDASDFVFESTIMAYADEYLESIIGVGDENNGIVLVIYINENNAYDRGYWISTQGKEVDNFMDPMEDIMSSVKDKLSDGNYEGAASAFLDCTANVFRFGKLPPSVGVVLICTAIGFVIALIVVLAMKSKMKNVQIASAADGYLREDTVDIRNCNVVFVRKEVTRTRRESSSSSGGGGGSHSSSSGTSHGGGGGRF